mgnify:CR=1 FL=1
MPCSRPGEKRVTAAELYELRRAQLVAEEAALQAQLLQAALRRKTLEIERKYGLLGCRGVLDIHTGQIQGGGYEPERNAHPGAP